MNVIAPRTLRAFWEQHPHAETPLRDWLKEMQKGDFTSFSDVRQVWSHADLVHNKGERPNIIFNIGGNKYRLITTISWEYKTVHIKHILTHADYNAWSKRG